MADGNDVVIKGGSVEIDFDPATYVPVPGDNKKFRNATKKITGVVIKDENGNVVPQVPADGKCTITISIQ